MKQIYARQGDLLFLKDDKVDEGKSIKKIVVAEGEFSGHHHLLIAETKSSLKGNKTHFTVTGRAKLIHPEHGEISFPAGNYTVILEREHDYIEDSLKVVRD